MKLKVFFFFTQTAAASREVGGLQHSRLTGSSSQTTSAEETVKDTRHMTSYINSGFRLGGSVESLWKI